MIWLLVSLFVHDPITTKITWSTEISRIVARRCESCHGSGSAVDLSNYASARPWAVAIRNQVLQKTMPPWGAVKGFGDFRNDASLTALETEMLTQWVEGGAPEGDPKFLSGNSSAVRPPSPKFRWTPALASVPKPINVRALRVYGPTEISAILTDGTVKHLIWVRKPLPNYDTVYVLRDPLALPVGTKVQIAGARVEFGS